MQESHPFGMPHSSEGPYALGKRVAIPYLEGLAFGGCGTRCAILTNLFGPYDHFGQEGAHVVPSLIARFVDAQEKAAPEVRVWGRPDTSRDFLFSHDAAAYLMDVAHEAACSRGFSLLNIASGMETSMGELAGTIATEVGYQGSVRWDPSAPIGVSNRYMDVRRLRSISRRIPCDLRRALRSTIDWYRKHRS